MSLISSVAFRGLCIRSFFPLPFFINMFPKGKTIIGSEMWWGWPLKLTLQHWTPWTVSLKEIDHLVCWDPALNSVLEPLWEEGGSALEPCPHWEHPAVPLWGCWFPSEVAGDGDGGQELLFSSWTVRSGRNVRTPGKFWFRYNGPGFWNAPRSSGSPTKNSA